MELRGIFVNGVIAGDSGGIADGSAEGKGTGMGGTGTVGAGTCSKDGTVDGNDHQLEWWWPSIILCLC